MKVPKKYLLFLAGLIWSIAGFNVFKIGLEASNGYWTVMMFLLSAFVYLAFQKMVFGKMVIKHADRIASYVDENQPFYHFFDKTSYLIMAFMMSIGIGIRYFELAPLKFIAVFYSGLGLSLLVAGIGFFIEFVKFSQKLKQNCC